jgi:hypothetical protein
LELYREKLNYFLDKYIQVEAPQIKTKMFTAKTFQIVLQIVQFNDIHIKNKQQDWAKRVIGKSMLNWWLSKSKEQEQEFDDHYFSVIAESEYEYLIIWDIVQNNYNY